MHVKSLSLDFSPELIPYDCFIHPNLICLPRMTSEKTKAGDRHASDRTAGTVPTLYRPASPWSSDRSFSPGGNDGSSQKQGKVLYISDVAKHL